MSEALPEINDIGLVDLGPMNKSALKRLANLAQHIIDNNLPIPPSPFVGFVVIRITGKDKQDFRMIISGETGIGKSYAALYLAQRIAKRTAKVLGGIQEDYFSLDNCALLEDTEGINKVLKIAKKHQVVIIDDAGVAVGSRDFATIQNKNFNKLLATCRTQRWCLIITVPMQTHLDKQIRELVYVKAVIYKSFHEGGFNILKMGKVKILQNFRDKPIYPRLAYGDRKVDFWVAYAPDPELAKEYDMRRDAAAQRLIDESITGEEIARLSPRQQKWEQIVKDHYQEVKIMKGKSISSIMIECDLTERHVKRLLAKARQEEKAKERK